MPTLKKRYIALLVIAALIPVLLVSLPYIARFAMVKLLADNLQLQAQIEDVDLNLFTGRAVIKNMFITGQHRSELRGAQLSADLDMQRLLQGELVAESIRLEGLHLRVVEGGAGEPVVLIPLAGGGDDGESEALAVPLFSLQKLELLDVSVDVEVMRLMGTLKVDVLRLAGLSTLQSQPGQLLLQADWNGSPLAIEGTLSPFDAQPWFEGSLELSKVQLAELNPYLPPKLSGLAGRLGMRWEGRASSEAIDLTGRVRIEDMVVALAGLRVSGESFAWDGAVAAALLADSPTFDVSGDIDASLLSVVDDSNHLTLFEIGELALDHFAIDEQTHLRIAAVSVANMRALDQGEEEQRLLFAREMRVQTLDFRDDRVTVDAITGQEVVSTVRITAGGELVSQGVLSKSLEALEDADAAEDASQPADEPESAALQWRIGGIDLRNSRLNFFDEQFDPPLHVKLAVDELTLGQVDSLAPDDPARLALKAEVGDFGRLEIAGQFTPLAPASHTALTGHIKSLPLPLVSPYVEQLLGYELVAGQFDHDFDIAIENNQINATNELKLRKLKVEEMKGVTGTAPLPMPLGFALDLLRDKDDHIALSIPLKGQLDDPQFGLDQAISKALGTALQKGSTTFLKLVLQPYGAIWMGAEMGLKMAGKMRLDPMAFPPLQSDLGATQADYAGKLALILEERPKLNLQMCGVAGREDFAAIMQRLAEETAAVAAAAQVATEDPAQAEVEGNGDSAPPAPVAAGPAEVKELTQLADARTRNLKRWLVNEKGIAADRLYPCKPKADPEGKLSGVDLSL